MTSVQLRASQRAAELIGKEAPYSKIGRDRRAALRKKIAEALVTFYQEGYFAGSDAAHHAIFIGRE